ncbi:hypothetical protein TNCV_946661 [Trichonephila clavipes]|nr:hypothetical protein TNCV_946661 [Trichonephila clavipes]
MRVKRLHCVVELRFSNRMRFFQRAFGIQFIFMDHKIHPHKATLIDDYLEEEDIYRMVWSARKKDFNYIRNAWDALGRLIGCRYSFPECFSYKIVTSGRMGTIAD